LTVWGADQVEYSLGSVALSSDPILQDIGRQTDRWIYPETAVAFIPEHLLASTVPPGPTVVVVAEGGSGVRERVAAWGEARGYSMWVPTSADFAYIQGVRLVVWALAGTALGVALLVLALGAADRARERRRAVARQIMVGVPARVLRLGQFIQTLVPALIAIALAIGAGLLGARAYANISDGLATLEREGWTVIVGLGVAGSLLAALTAVPLIRVRIAADLLRRE
jgi:hypothetical protein